MRLCHCTQAGELLVPTLSFFCMLHEKKYHWYAAFFFCHWARWLIIASTEPALVHLYWSVRNACALSTFHLCFFSITGGTCEISPISTVAVFFRFLFSALIRTGSCLSVIRSLTILQRSLYLLWAPFHSLNGKASRWMPTFLTCFWVPFDAVFITWWGWVAFILTSFPDNEN